MLREATKSFCLSTSLHGYKFIALPKRVLLERSLWCILSFLALISAIVLSLEAWESFQKDPILTVTDSTHYPIWNYHFPAVTICNINKISSEAVWNLIKNITLPKHIKMTAQELHKEFQLLIQLILPEDDELPMEALIRLQDILDFNKLDVEKALLKVSPVCNMVSCKWKGEDKRCGSIFETVKTTLGFCCSFNYFAGKNHSFNGETPLKAPTKPRRVSACGYRTGLEIILENNISDYHSAFIPTLGYKALIHHPYEFPDWSTKFMLANEKSITFLSSTPIFTYPSPEIRNLKPQQRKCLHQDEKELKIYQKYTFRNCINECRMELFKRYCRCVPFFYYNNEDKIIISFIGFDFDRTLLPQAKISSDVEKCSHCYDNCQYTEYPFEGSSGYLESNNSNEAFLEKSNDQKNYTVIKVFFNDLVGVRNRKDVHYNWHTLLALFGGILGLFVGFSFVSGFEVIYFFAIRIFIKLVTKKKKESKVMHSHY